MDLLNHTTTQLIPEEQQQQHPATILEEPSKEGTSLTAIPNISISFNECDAGLEHAIKGAIDSLETFDETQREQTYYKNIVKDSFSTIFKRNCNIVKDFTLENHLPGIALRMKKLPLEGQTELTKEETKTFNSELFSSNHRKSPQIDAQGAAEKIKQETQGT